MATRKPKPEDKDRGARRSGFDILSSRAGRFLATFYALWVALAGLLIYARILVAAAGNRPLDWPEIVIIVVVSTACAVAVAFPLAVGIVEGLPMVLAEMYTNRVRAEAHAEGREEGREEGLDEGLAKGRDEGRQEGAQLMLSRWRDWNRRRLAAQQAGQPFTEPEPDLD